MRSENVESGVSAMITSTMASCKKNLFILEKQNTMDFSIKVANTLEEREAVFLLGYQIYLDKGYIKSNTRKYLIQNYDFDSETVILIVQDQNKKIAGSITIVFDGSSQLPSESIYQDEICSLRSSGIRMAEISRLIINPDFRNFKEILVLLFNYLAIYIHHVMHYGGFVIQVNPRHKNYYKSLLEFEEIGAEKPYPQVQCAPAVLLFLSTARYQAEVLRCSFNRNASKKERSLYPYFLHHYQEKLVANYLANQKKAISMEERMYFGFSESNNYSKCLN